jgi:hypothetical protein
VLAVVAAESWFSRELAPSGSCNYYRGCLPHVASRGIAGVGDAGMICAWKRDCHDCHDCTVHPHDDHAWPAVIKGETTTRGEYMTTTKNKSNHS